MTARPVSAGVRRTCQALAVAGGLAMMTGFLLAVVATVAGPSVLGGLVPVSLVAPGLMVAGLFCGVMLIAVTAPGSRPARRRSSARSRSPLGPPISSPEPSPSGRVHRWRR